MSPDSIYYLQTAENFKNGYGISIRDADGLKAMTHWAPLYPVMLSFFNNFKILNVILSFITSFLIGVIILRATNSIYASILSVILFSFSPTYIFIFSHLWSETLSIPFILITIIFIKKYLNSQKIQFLIIFSILIAISTLIRYANLFFILAIMLIFFIYRFKVSHLIISLFISSSLFILWQIRNSLSPNPQATKEFSLHIFSSAHFSVLLETLKNYILPPYSESWQFIIMISLLLGIIMFLISRKENVRFSNWEKMLLICAISVIIFLFISISTMYYNILPDIRILSPFFIFMFCSLFIFVYRILHFKLNGILIYLALLLGYVNYTFSYINEVRENPSDLNSPIWSNLEIIKELKKLPSNSYIYTNVPDIIYLHTKHFASMIPRKYNPVNNKLEYDFKDEIREMEMKLRKNDGFLVIIYPFSRFYLPTKEELEHLIPLEVYKETRDGIIYKVRK